MIEEQYLRQTGTTCLEFHRLKAFGVATYLDKCSSYYWRLVYNGELIGKKGHCTGYMYDTKEAFRPTDKRQSDLAIQIKLRPDYASVISSTLYSSCHRQPIQNNRNEYTMEELASLLRRKMALKSYKNEVSAVVFPKHVI
jgi:hypothetical protein